jgi:hypothetical protein
VISESLSQEIYLISATMWQLDPSFSPFKDITVRSVIASAMCGFSCSSDNMIIDNAVDAETLCSAVVDAGFPTLKMTLVNFDFNAS